MRELSRIAGMRREWDALLDSSMAGPFNAWEWLYPWCRRIGADCKPFVMLARDRAGTLVGLMPLGVPAGALAGRGRGVAGAAR